MSPAGADPQTPQQQARRPSRSPRSQRSRSADVDCLKKYVERRVEVRRHTEAGETSRWIPLGKGAARASIPTKDHSLAYASALARARGSPAAAGSGPGHREGDRRSFML